MAFFMIAEAYLVIDLGSPEKNPFAASGRQRYHWLCIIRTVFLCRYPETPLCNGRIAGYEYDRRVAWQSGDD